MQRSILFLLIFTAVLSSCADKTEISKIALLKRQWTIVSNDLNSQHGYLSFEERSGRQTYQTNLKEFRDTTGRWDLIDDSTIVLFGRPIFESDQIDSTVLKGSEGIIYYSNGSEAGRMINNSFEPVRYEYRLSIDELSERKLSFSISGEIPFEFIYKAQTIQNKFSIISILRGLLGILALLSIAWLASTNRKRISWPLVIKGILIQIILALALLKVPFITSIFEGISAKFIEVIGFTQEGTKFLFGSFLDQGNIDNALISFAFNVLPTIIFFSALTSLFYYWGILQQIVKYFAFFMQKILGLSGAESMAAAGNVFLGQTEAPLLIKPYLLGMTKSEFMTLMTGGMATIAGGVLAGYISFLGGGDPAQELFFAKHLLIASVMSAPAAIVAAKILVPETESFNKDLDVPKEKLGTNALEAISNGTTDGLKLAVNVATMLLVFIAFVAFGNSVLSWFGDLFNINDWIAENTAYQTLSFDFILGYACAPLIWLIGVPDGDVVFVGELLGKKTVLNEFIGYLRLGEMKSEGLLSDKAILMSTYLLCGFANFASIGIQIGGIGALVPQKKSLLSKLGLRALLGGTIACLLTAVVVGMMV